MDVEVHYIYYMYQMYLQTEEDPGPSPNEEFDTHFVYFVLFSLGQPTGEHR